MADPTINIVVKADTRDAESGLGGLHGALGKLGGLGGIATKAIAGLAVGAAAAAAGGIAALGKGLFDCVQEASAAEVVTAQLEAVIKSTGGVAGITADEANNLATALSQVTRFDDEAIVSGESMLLTFKEIGEDIFPEATEAMLNMSTAMGQDLQSSAIMLGKALNDPIQGLSALRRVGIQFTDAQEAAIKKMVEMGDVAGAQKMILAELESQFGGSARAAGETYAGQLDILKNKFSNIKETIGNAVLPILTELAGKFSAALDNPKVQEAIQRIVQWLSVNLPAAIASVAGWIQDSLIPAIQAVVAWFKGDGSDAVSSFASKLTDFLAPAIEFAQALFQQIVGWVQANWPLIQATIQTVMEAVRTVIETVLTAIRAFWDEHGAQIMLIVDNVWTVIKTIISTTIATIQSVIKAVMLLIKGDWEGAWNEIKAAAERIWEAIKTVITAAWTNVRTALEIIWSEIQGVFANVWAKFQEVGHNIVEGIRQGISNAWGAVRDWLLSQLQGLIDDVLGFFGIHSPSSVFAGIGAQLMAGLAQGIGQGIDMPINAAITAGGAVTAATGAATTNTYNNYNLTIHSSAPAESALSDFHTMVALAGV